ncbi:putative two-component system response regulator [Pseudonocardia sp. Ae168_Ps1]|uniref:response regulator transcription factor n=1 Tax=unclassified Pseudonocardia TaxID=2619320 RepID=UPI00094B0A84|nr:MULTISPECIES: response regulator transcription factor [unclassified Pseudonocardia]OLL73573.1 putative two-component system response regulator [Pseudonocardia sp. Ae150A_Ps1]OLL79544.1 putative two-component system response regulator [Pseudonocardia sp. Ae168_Ps1]OLL86315.1 putative two-component system response regulator [Pseudonocardia sp. Ae263_Ps1]OLL93642.1 putative two-component system response regulator [Pseudonocardia sp. Ae356_Ps1]
MTGASPILIVDDHELVGSALALNLRAEGEDATFQPVRSAAGVLDHARRGEPGLIVLDLDLGRDPDGNRIDGVRLVAPLVDLGWRVVVLSGSSDAGWVGAALDAGGFVFVPKNAPFPALLNAIREARAGRSVMPPGRREQFSKLHRDRESERRDLHEKLNKLTQREREVLALLAGGKRAQAVADHFVVSLATVRTQIRAVLTKLEVGSQLEAVALYRKAAGL